MTGIKSFGIWSVTEKEWAASGGIIFHTTDINVVTAQFCLSARQYPDKKLCIREFSDWIEKDKPEKPYIGWWE